MNRADLVASRLAVATLLVFAGAGWFVPAGLAPEKDEYRYIDYALSLSLHGVFGLNHEDASRTPPAGRANAPLYPAFVAALASVDKSLEASMRCVNDNRMQQERCIDEWRTLVAAQYLVGALTLFLTWRLALALGLGSAAALLALWLAIASGVVQDYAATALTENLVLTGGVLLCLLIALDWQRGSTMLAAAAGAALGGLALTRPEYLYLLPAVLLAFWLTRGRNLRGAARAATAICCVFALVLSPWLLRNQATFGSPALTSGYADVILGQRLAYNDMRADEWLTAFVYWLPDFGDSLSETALPATSWERLRDSAPNSLYSRAAPELAAALEETPRDELLGKWLVERVLLDAPAHAAVTAVLFWRGLFFAKYWSLVAAPVFLFLLARTRLRTALLPAALPVLWLMALHAGISINVPRYNVMAMPLYACALAWALRPWLERKIAGWLQPA